MRQIATGPKCDICGAVIRAPHVIVLDQRVNLALPAAFLIVPVPVTLALRLAVLPGTGGVLAAIRIFPALLPRVLPAAAAAMLLLIAIPAAFE